MSVEFGTVPLAEFCLYDIVLSHERYGKEHNFAPPGLQAATEKANH